MRLVVSYIGFETTTSAEIQVQGNQTTFVDIAVPEAAFSIQEVVVRQNLNLKRIESPISEVLSIGVQEIEKSAGANRDVSKVVQALPGVGATISRNDLIVRGGGTSENVFYLDGVEIPVINHFATQGSSGGAIGVIGPDFVREINFYTGAFPANRTNALSSVMEIRQKDSQGPRTYQTFSRSFRCCSYCGRTNWQEIDFHCIGTSILSAISVSGSSDCRFYQPTMIFSLNTNTKSTRKMSSLLSASAPSTIWYSTPNFRKRVPSRKNICFRIYPFTNNGTTPMDLFTSILATVISTSGY